MTFSQVCPVCRAAEVVQAVWSAQCLACGRVFHHAPDPHVPAPDPGVDTPVREGHSLISSAAPVADVPPPPAPPVEAPVAEVTAEVK